MFTKSLKVIELYFNLKGPNIDLVHYFVFVMNTLNTWQCLIHVDLPDLATFLVCKIFIVSFFLLLGMCQKPLDELVVESRTGES